MATNASQEQNQVLVHMQNFMKSCVELSRQPVFKQAQAFTDELLASKKKNEEDAIVIRRERSDLQEADVKILALENELKATRESLQLRQKEKSRLERELKEANARVAQQKQTIIEQTTRVGELEKFQVTLNSETTETVRARWLQLWSSVRGLTGKYFNDMDCGQSILDNTPLWERLNKLRITTNIPIIASNSDEAKRMRAIAATASIGYALHMYVFRNPMENDNSVEQQMFSLALQNPGLEASYRSALLAVLGHLPGCENDVATESRVEVVDSVLDQFGGLLSGQAKDAFQGELEQLCAKAREEWWVIQRAVQRYDTCFRLEDEIDGWQPVHIEETTASLSTETKAVGKRATNEKSQTNGKGKNTQTTQDGQRSSQLRREAVAPVWPILRVIGKDGIDFVVRGSALFPHQTESARAELRKQERRSREPGRVGEGRRRGRSFRDESA